MNLLDVVNKEKQEFDWGYVTWLHEPINSINNRLSVSKVCIYNNKQQEKHLHLGEEQLFYIIEGNGIFIKGNKEIEVSKDKMIYMTPYSDHKVVNTGEQDLIFIVVYAPSTNISIERPSILTDTQPLEEMIALDLLQSIAFQLSQSLNIEINIKNIADTSLININKIPQLCVDCKSYNTCSLKSDSQGSLANTWSDVYICEFGVMEISIPINFNDVTIGSISTERFTIDSPKEFNNRIRKINDTGDSISHDIKHLFKSRVYAIHEHLTMAIEFIKVISEQDSLQRELIKKENEILLNTIENIELRDALKRHNNQASKNSLINISIDSNPYPYELESSIEKLIKSLRPYELNIMIDSKRLVLDRDIVKEMIIVISRNTLGSLKDTSLVNKYKVKYLRQLQNNHVDYISILKEFCNEIIRKLESTIYRNNTEPVVLLKEYIELRYKEKLELKEIASTLGINPNYLSHSFKKYYGISFISYINTLRITKAKELLEVTDLEIGFVGKKVGFNNTSYFISKFKDLEGLTPSKYRKGL